MTASRSSDRFYYTACAPAYILATFDLGPHSEEVCARPSCREPVKDLVAMLHRGEVHTLALCSSCSAEARGRTIFGVSPRPVKLKRRLTAPEVST